MYTRYAKDSNRHHVSIYWAGKSSENGHIMLAGQASPLFVMVVERSGGVAGESHGKFPLLITAPAWRSRVDGVDSKG